MQNRVKSPVVWGALAAQGVAILVTLGVFDDTMGDAVKAVVVAVLEMLTAFGVLNNPTDKGAF